MSDKRWRTILADFEAGDHRDRLEEADARHDRYLPTKEAQVDECWAIYHEFLSVEAHNAEVLDRNYPYRR